MPYTNNPAGDTTDQVRLLVFDVSTSTSGEYLSDAEIDWFISVTPSIYAAAALAANTLSAKFTSISASSYEEKQVGDLRLKKGDVSSLAANYRALADRLSRQASLTAAGAPYAGGISRSDKAGVESNPDRVKPFFTRGQFDNPWAAILIPGREPGSS